MRNLFVVLAVAAIALAACKKKDAGAGAAAPAEPEAEAAAAEPAAQAAEPDEPVSEKIALSEDRLKTYIAYGQELNQILRQHMADIAALGTSVDKKSSDVTKAGTAMLGVAELGKRHDENMRGLQKKHGMTQDEFQKIGEVVGVVVGARMASNPYLSQGFDEFKKQAAGSGPEAEFAKRILQQREESEKKALAKARERFGEDAVERLLKHEKDLAELQMGAMTAVFGGKPPAAPAK